MSKTESITAIPAYAPTVYVNNSEPDLDETHLNKTEQALKRVTDAANEAIAALKELDTAKISASQIVNNLLATDPGTVLAGPMGKSLSDKCVDLQNKYTQLNSELSISGIAAPYGGEGIINNDWIQNYLLCAYRVVNGICFVRFDINVKPITTDRTVLISGLPIPSLNTIYQCGGWMSNGSGVPLEMDVYGDLVAYVCPGGYIAGCVIYPVK